AQEPEPGAQEAPPRPPAATNGPPDAPPVPCRPDAPDRARCHRVLVPEDRSRAGGRELALHVLVLPAQGSQGEALFFFAGGPGSASTLSAEGVSALLGPAGEARDLVFVDFRGTGRSHPLACPRLPTLQAYFDAVWSRDRIARCWAEVSEDADPSHFGNPEIADDVEAVRRALGYGPVDLHGVSGGTRVAQTFLRRHGGSVRSVVLEGVVPMDVAVPLEYPRHAQRSLDLLVAECGADPACRDAYPDLSSDLRELFRRLGAEPARVPVTSGDGSTATVTYDADDLGYTLRGILYGSGAREIPWLVRRALEGDAAPLAQRYLDRWKRLEGRFTMGSHFSVFCSEDLAGHSPEEAERHGEGTLFGAFLIRAYLEGCAEWPVAPAPDGFRSPVRSDVPVLLLSGRIDPVTPPAFGVRVAGHLSRSTHVVFPRGGHGFDGGRNDCRRAVIRSFLLDPGRRADTSCVARIPPRKFRLPGEG
ncbi:MAG TPA: alpha/beta hydrolase, partial [Longimicrobiales bacterium]|nr:alpha/beta hydrolase [Longimicrobiales bacterium]